MPLYIFGVFIFLSPKMFVYCIFMTCAIGCWSFVHIKLIIYNFLNVCNFDYTAFDYSGKVRIPYTCFTPSVKWLSLPQLTVLSRPEIVVKSKVLVAFLCCHFLLFNILLVYGQSSSDLVRSPTFSLSVKHFFLKYLALQGLFLPDIQFFPI